MKLIIFKLKIKSKVKRKSRIRIKKTKGNYVLTLDTWHKNGAENSAKYEYIEVCRLANSNKAYNNFVVNVAKLDYLMLTVSRNSLKSKVRLF